MPGGSQCTETFHTAAPKRMYDDTDQWRCGRVTTGGSSRKGGESPGRTERTQAMRVGMPEQKCEDGELGCD
jgi:hypothetical protein